MGTSVLIDESAVFTRIGTKLHCEGVSLEELGNEYGTPLYVYSGSSIVERFREFDGAFAGIDHMVAYSVKANGNLSILRLLAEEGAGADIVSGGELFRALRAGVPAEKIVFSGVGKTDAELAAAVEAGIFSFNVESATELGNLSRIATQLGKEAPIALRINPDIETPTPHQYTRTGHRTSKFGIPSEESLDLYREAVRMPGIRIRGIAAHIGSQIEEVEPYERALEHLLGLVADLGRAGIELEYLDIGGGYGIRYSEGDPVRAAEFAAAIVPPLQGTCLKLVLEPGRYIVGHSGILLTRVLAVKEMGGKVFVITDAGMNDLLRPSHYSGYHEVEPVTADPKQERVRVDVVGPICETGDFLALDRELGLPREGDLLAIKTVGAYGFVMASQYNARPRPAEIMVEGDRARVIRARETFEDLVRGEEF